MIINGNHRKKFVECIRSINELFTSLHFEGEYIYKKKKIKSEIKKKNYKS